MNFLDKLGLTEPKSETCLSDSNLTIVPSSPTVPMTIIPSVNIQEFYEANGFTEGGVHQLNAYMSTMPSTLTDEQKVKTVIGILDASKANLADMLADGVKRTAALQANMDSELQACADHIQGNVDAIAALQTEIARYQKDTEETGDKSVDIKKAFTAEIDKVQQIAKPFNEYIKKV